MKNKNKSKEDIINVIKECKEKTVVAFKENINGEWFTGTIDVIVEPYSKILDKDEYFISISVNSPGSIDWDEDNKMYYFLEDIADLVILENN